MPRIEGIFMGSKVTVEIEDPKCCHLFLHKTNVGMFLDIKKQTGCPKDCPRASPNKDWLYEPMRSEP